MGMIITTKDKYRKEVCKIWEELGDTKKVKKISKLNDIYKEHAFLQNELYKNSLLFLGVGASNSKDKKGKIKNKYCDKEQYKRDGGYYEIQYETKEGRDEYQYYKPMIKLAEQIKFDNWSNIDITLFRETNQKVLESFFQNSSLTNIMQKQLNLATRMIKDVEPKIIIASNTLVRKIFRIKR